jgi:membrane protease YdiL (CAAX protease family)
VTGDPSKLPEQDSQRADKFAAELRGFGPIGIVAMLVVLLSGNAVVGGVVVPVGGIMAVMWMLLSRTPWREIGYVRPRSWIGAVVGGLVFGCVFKLVMKAIVMPILGAPEINAPYHYLAGNRAMLPVAILGMITAGFAEETVFRGFLFERFFKVFGTGAGAKASVVVLSAALFAAGHYVNLGVFGVEQAMFTGVVFGAMFAFSGQIWTVIWAHAGYDLASLAIIYWKIEADVAHLVFK